MKKTVKEQFRSLLEKYHQGTVTAEEKALVDEWFEVLGEREAKEMLTDEERLALKSDLRKFIDSKKDNTRELPWYQRPWRVAAAILLLTCSSYLIWQFSQGNESEIATVQTVSETGMKKVLLSDGSIVWLKGNSSITYPEKFTGDTRQVTLSGEALFEVEKDPAHPFTIHSGGLVTTVLGTSFNIKNTEAGTEIYVLTGKVSVTASQSDQKIEVLPSEKIVYARATQLLSKVEPVRAEKTEQYIAGTEYDMNFIGTKLSDIAQRIEAKFNVKVEMSDPAIGNCLITGNFTDQSLKRTLSMISDVFGYEYELNDSTVILKGKGCE